MGSSIESLFKRNQIAYQPEQWSKRLGEKCESCSKNLTHERCISLCKCYYFCHQQCFTDKFETQIYDEATDVKCEKCDWELRLQLEVQFKYQPDFAIKKLVKLSLSFILLLLAIFAIIVTLNSEIRLEISFFLLYLEGIILSLFLWLIVLNIRDLLYRKNIKIKEVGTTKLEIQTSAFKDL